MIKNAAPIATVSEFGKSLGVSQQKYKPKQSPPHAILANGAFKIGKIVVLVLSLAISLTSTARADWHCQCGTIIHVNYPTTCPVCNRSLPNPTPPFTLPGGSVHDGTGLRLGVNVYSSNGRVVVQSVQPGTPAHGKLFPNDQLVKGDFRDPLNGQVYRVEMYSPDDITRLKALAGVGTKVALEVYRPTSGTRSFFISFATDGVVTSSKQKNKASGQTPNRPQGNLGSAIIQEDTTGEAAQWLNGAGRLTNGGSLSATIPTGDSPSDLLNGP